MMNKYEDFIPKNEKGVTVEKGIFFNSPGDLTHKIGFYPMFGGEYKATYPYKVQRNFMDSFLLIFVKDGQMRFHFRNKIFYAENQIVLLDCKEQNYYSVTDESDFYFLHFNSPFMQQIFDNITQNNIPVFSPYENIEELFVKIFHLIATNTEGQNDSYLSDLIYSLVCDMTLKRRNNVINNSSDFHSVPNYITNAISYMEKNCNQKIKVSNVAYNCSTSPSQLSRDFKKYTGTSIHSYLLEIRIKKAKSLLVEDITMPLEKVAVSCGFTDASHLYKKIKENTGMSPGKFRKKYY